jgi:transposase InsO family protein
VLAEHPDNLFFRITALAHRPSSLRWTLPFPGRNSGGWVSLYKTELIHRKGPWRSCEAVEYATLEWVDWFNNRRLLEPIGNIPPAEAEARYYAQLEEADMAA